MKHLVGAREAARGEKWKEPITDDTFASGLHEKLPPKIRFMHLKHKNLWSLKLGNVSAIKRHIHRVSSALTFKAASYQAQSKTVEHEIWI